MLQPNINRFIYFLNRYRIGFQMSSDLYVFDESLFLRSSPEMVSSGADMQFYSGADMQFDTDTCFLNRFIAGLPPSYQMENLSLYESTQLKSMSDGSILGNGCGDLTGLEVKDEEFQMDLVDQRSFSVHCSGAGEYPAKMIQRSFSSYFDREKAGFRFHPQLDAVVESPNFQNQPMRRVCSTGDLQITQTSFMEESSFKVGRYNAEERKQRILKYRAKRNQRNFNKTIKYACRKTLADNRPRIRGRFARNDDGAGETPKASCSARDDDDEFLLDGLVEEEHGAFMGSFVNHCGQNQFHYYGY